jgi:hypothetical protein
MLLPQPSDVVPHVSAYIMVLLPGGELTFAMQPAHFARQYDPVAHLFFNTRCLHLGLGTCATL